MKPRLGLITLIFLTACRSLASPTSPPPPNVSPPPPIALASLPPSLTPFLPATPTAVPTARPQGIAPTASPQPSTQPLRATTQPPPSPTILSFTATPTTLDPGDSVTFTWTSTGGTKGTLWRLMPTGQFGTWWDVAPNGTLTLPTDVADRNSRTYMLFVTDDAGVNAQASVTVIFTCPDVWFFTPAPQGCPGDSATFSSATQQEFEYGFMIWMEAHDFIYVMFLGNDSPAWEWASDFWRPEEPAYDPRIISPGGLFQPLRGFGKLWRALPGVRDRLGWALTPDEQAFDGAFQRDSAPKYSSFYLRAADGRVIHLKPERSGWEWMP